MSLPHLTLSELRRAMTNRSDEMATLSVLKFNDPDGADRVLTALEGLHDREMIILEDAAVVSWPRGNKKPRTHELLRLARVGGTAGGLWGLLLGFIFFAPLLGAAIGAGMGAFIGSMAKVGIDEDFIKEVRGKVTEGTSALFALTSGATVPEQVIDELKQYNFEIISTNLSEEQEKKLREAFAQE
jgi:uncharacterized membrane protein